MKEFCFPYKREPSRLFREIYRPVVEVELKAKDGAWIKVSAYADSGADITIFPRTVSEILGLELERGIESIISGVAGEQIKIYVHQVPIKIGDQELNVRVGFAERDDVPYVLGRTDILNNFDIRFETNRVCFIVKR